MCGIHLSICATATTASHSSKCLLNEALKRRLCNRGPDHSGQVKTRWRDELELLFTSTVLSLRGNHVTPQPFEDPESGSVLCWNGEAWKIRGRAVLGSENDGAAVFELLASSLSYLSDGNPLAAATTDEDRQLLVLDVFRSIEGPFAFVFFDKPFGKLYFGRDRLGRRSLVSSREATGGTLFLSSVAESTDATWEEVEADGVYVLDLNNLSLATSSSSKRVRHAWSTGGSDAESRIGSGDAVPQQISGIGRFNTAVPSVHAGPVPPALSTDSESVWALREHLTESLRLRVLNVPVPPTTPSAGAAGSSSTDVRIAILFSGGLDCTVLASLCHDLVPTTQGIDLLNVAFENPRVASQLKLRADAGDKPVDVFEACPDRLSGRKSFDELLRICPGRAWRFIAVNVPYAETTAHRDEVVSLIHPHNTEMDLSIAYALYFAARGEGIPSSGSEPTGTAIHEKHTTNTPARVLLSGLGADELFGGYVRHTTAFSRHGYPGLVEELKLDVGRLGKRNLGRDDRAMSHWGKEVRFPYLDEDLVRWAIELPVWEKCDFGKLDAGNIEPGKRVLRLLAEQLGMTDVAREKKRAIQFGSRTAKMESGKVKGTTLIS